MSEKLVVDLLNPDMLIKVNELKRVTNPLFFDRNNAPTVDGLLSNEIFGITSDERRNNFAYIELTEWFIHPLYYSIWCKVDSKIRDCVHETKNFTISPQGYLEESETGSNGIKWLKDNIDKIRFKTSNSIKRDERISFLMHKKDKAFMKQLIVLPALYRDVQSAGGKTGVGEINSLYVQIIIGVRALEEAKDYGFSMGGPSRGRVQELILSIYDYFGSGTVLQGTEIGGILPGKLGAIRRTGISKTTDRATRLVISAPELKVERMEDMMVDMTHSAVPLASICVNFYPYMIFHIRRFFENEFGGDTVRQAYNPKTKKIEKLHIKDYEIAFSDNRIHKEMDRFIHGYSNRLIPIEIPTVEKTDSPIYMKFIGRRLDGSNNIEDYQKAIENGTADQMPIVDRYLTWCDVFFIAANEFAAEKTVLLTRYPIDSYYNQFPSKIVVGSTVETEPMIIRGNLLRFYPKIRQEDIGSNTSTMFVDTLRMANPNIKPAGGDYDGDQMSSKGVYLVEANKELEEYMNSKAFYISLGGKVVRSSSLEALQTIYQLTRVLPGTKLTEKVK